MSLLQSIAHILGFKHKSVSPLVSEANTHASVLNDVAETQSIVSEHTDTADMKENMIKTNIVYVEPQSSTQEDVCNYLVNDAHGITFIHGKAGCGKSYLIRVVLKISLGRFRVCFRGQSVSKRRSNAGIVTKRTYTLHRMRVKITRLFFPTCT